MKVIFPEDSHRTIRTSEEFEAEMQIISDQNMDPELTHMAMDKLMCDILKELGYDKGVEIFEWTTKYYS